MQGRLENQLKTERLIRKILTDLPKEVNEYYLNISTSKEFRTCLEYVKKLRGFLRWYSETYKVNLRKIDFSQITDIEIAQYLKSIEIKQNKDGDVEFTSFSYRKGIYSIINGFFDFLFKKRYISTNPVLLIDKPKKKDKPNHIFLKEKELNKMVNAVHHGAGNVHSIRRQEKWKSRDLAILYTFLLTGMRESALCEIDLNKINFETNTIEVIDKEHKHNSYTISNKLRGYLLAWLEERESFLNGAECDALFISNRRKRIDQATVRVIVNKYSEEALGYKVSPHKLRAAYGNIVYRETGSINKARSALKHENVATTQVYYLEDDEKLVNEEVANILNKKF